MTYLQLSGPKIAWWKTKELQGVPAQDSVPQ
jgi:hypothetical protein